MRKSEFNNLQKLILHQELVKADAIVWLQGDRLDRGKKVVDLFCKKFASRIIISGNNLLIGRGKRIGENDISLEKIKLWLIKNDIPKKSIIVDNLSLNTAEQALHVLELCVKNKWKKIIIVSSPYHQVRAFLTFLKYSRVVGSDVQIINQPAVELPWDKKVSGRNQSGRELIQEEISKIKKYQSDVVSVQTGIDYLDGLKNNKL